MKCGCCTCQQRWHGCCNHWMPTSSRDLKHFWNNSTLTPSMWQKRTTCLASHGCGDCGTALNTKCKAWTGKQHFQRWAYWTSNTTSVSMSQDLQKHHHNKRSDAACPALQNSSTCWEENLVYHIFNSLDQYCYDEPDRLQTCGQLQSLDIMISVHALIFQGQPLLLKATV